MNTLGVDYLWGLGSDVINDQNQVALLAAKLDDGGVFTDLLPDLWSDGDHTPGGGFPNSPVATPNFTWVGAVAGDALYFGWDSDEVTGLRADMEDSTLQGGASATIAWEYWNGSSWTALSGVSDILSSFKGNTTATTTWTAPGDWAKTEIDSDGVMAFYVRARLASGTYNSDPVISGAWGADATGWAIPNWAAHNDITKRSVMSNVQNAVTPGTWRVQPIGLSKCLPNDERGGFSIDFWNLETQNTNALVRINEIDYKDEFAISFGYFFHYQYDIDKPGNINGGTYPDQMGFSVGFNLGYNGAQSREIRFSVRDEQNDTDSLGPYLELVLFDNNEAAPDNQGLASGEIFTHTDPLTGEPARAIYKAFGSVGTDGWFLYDRTTRVYFVGFTLERNFLPDETEYWKCSFYNSGQFATVSANVAEVPHDILHQTPGEMYLWNMFDDGSGEPLLERTDPHLVSYPFMTFKALSQAQWDSIAEAALGQTYGVSGYFDVVTSPGPPVRGMDHTSEIRGNQIRDMHHTHTNFGNAQFVPPVITKRFRLTLTGTPDATTDVQIPLRSFNVSKNSIAETSVSFVMPYRDELMEALNDRPNGVLRLEFSLLDSDGENPNWVTYLDATQGDSGINLGALSQAVIIEGQYDTVTLSPVTHTLESTSIVRERIEAGIHSVVAEFDPNIKPGDTVNYTTALQAESFVVQQVLVSASNNGTCEMTLQEDSGSG
jgi:hypothetical protein